jgi:cell wall-associated NlpC family hydrolase
VNETAAPPPKATAGVVGAAQKWLGTPYSWGGGGPSGPSKGFGRGASTVGFDCSSLLQYAYAQQGKTIPRVTYDQWKTGKAVPNEALQPGDAVFFRPGQRGPEHVGIYVGEGKFVEAPKTGDVVKISDLAGRSDYMGARRW